jgi:rubrerythrin
MEIAKLKSQLQTEVDTSFLYKSIAAIQTDENLNKVLLALAQIEDGHAQHMLTEIKKVQPNFSLPNASSRAKFQLKNNLP